MPKQLNVSLAFTADTSQAKRQLQELQQQLTQLTNGSLGKTKDLGLVKDIQDATAAAAQLKVQLESATNVTTGKLDLGKFNDSLKQSGMTLADYKTQLDKLGPDGSKAFLSLAQSISNAEMPLRRTNALVKEFGVTLMNAARWQFSSSVLHGLMSAVQGAYGYAQDLNESLTNIAIVTGRSTEQMAQFAEQANKSAQALSTTTTAYTDAALIYYQQGLGDAAVKERTDVTIQLANVTGQSAEQVSSYMTAIWNNFEDGSHSMEYYADVITALGAATASSSEEIAKGMQQFASVADTVGLSYEYAATALATVVAQTRQSESTVGNSFRTIFSRLQGLKLGDTLEDGTDLNKYSAALQTIGVHIKDQNGELKDMDTILNEIGAKWQTLTKDQQVALAQTVGGVRQYTNLIALFDNWDTFQRNLTIANDAEGSLGEQAERYAQSWEAAQKRVKAAWQAIYQDLIDDKFFISMLNGIEKVLQGVDALIDSIGGIKGVLITVGSLATTFLEKQMAEGIRNATYSLKMMTAEGRAELSAKKEEAWDLAKQTSFDTGTASGAAQAAQMSQTAEVQKALLANAEQMTAEEQKIYQLRIDGLRAAQDELVASGKEVDSLRQQTDQLQQQMILKSKGVDQGEYQKRIGKFTDDTAAYATSQSGFNELKDSLSQTEINVNNVMSAFDKLWAGAEGNNKLDAEISDLFGKLEQIVQVEEEIDKNGKLIKINVVVPEDKKEELEEINKEVQRMQSESSFNQAKREQRFTQSTNVDPEMVEQYTDAVIKETQADMEQEAATERVAAAKEHLINDINNQKVAEQDLATTIVQSAQIVTSFMSALNMLSTAWKTLENPDLSGWEKFKSVSLSLAMAIPMLVRGFTGLKEVFSSTAAGQWLATKAEVDNALVVAQNTLVVQQNTLAKQKNALATMEKDLADKVNLLTMQGFTKEEALEHFALERTAIAKQKSAIASTEEAIATTTATVATNADAAAHYTLTAGIKAATAATIEFLTLHPEIVAIVAILAGLVIAIKSAMDAWNADAKATEEAKEKAQELKEEYQELKQSFDDLKSTLEDHQGAVNALEDLKRGTEEWTKAVQDLNQQTLDLIAKYPELAQYVENTNGAIHLSQEGMQEYINAQYKETQGKYLDFIKGQQDFYEKDSASKVTDTARSIGYGQSSEVTTSTGTYTTQKTASNEEIMAAVEAFRSNSEDFLKAGENTANYTKAFADLLAKQGITDEALIQALWDNRNEVANLSQELDANVAASTGLSDAFYQAGVQNEMGEVVEEKVGDDSYLVAPVEEYLAQQVANTQAQLEANGVESMDAYVQALNEVKQNYIDNADQINARADRQASADVAGQVAANGGILDQRDWDSYWDSLSSDDKKLLISVGIDDAKSIPECEAKLAEIKEDLDNNYQIDFAVDADVDQEELENLTNYIHDNADAIEELDDHLVDCRKESAKVAHAILRFDDAIQDVTKNYDDWSHALKKGTMQDAAKAAAEMTDAYGDLLDIDGSQLSSDFLQNAENLDLMKQAIEGNEDAYNELQQKAGEDILVQCGIDKDRWEADHQYIENRIFDLTGQKWDDIEVGAELNDQAFLDELTNMVNSAGMSAEQAQAYLASMGIDAEIEEQTVDSDETQETASFQPVLTPETRHGSATTIVGDEPQPVPLDYEVYGVDYQPVPDSFTTQKQAKSFTLKVTSAHKSSGGNFKYSNSNHGGGSGGGGGKGKGSCFAAGTLITADNCYKNIEDIKVGDIVLSYNEKTKKNEFSEVLQTMIHFVHEKIYNLFVKNDKLVVTGNHKFLITHKDQQEWIEASDIQIGDFVLLADGTLCEISDIDIETKFLTVYNFEVSNTHNYYVGKNQILAHNKGGGGGGGKAKKKKVEKPKEKKENIKEKDRYHNIKEQIEDLNTEMERLGKNKDRAYGKDRIKYMDQEIDRTKKQIGLTKEYIKEIKDYAKQDKTALEKTLKDIGMSDANIAAQFDENGVLKDYESLLEAIQDKFDKTATAAYNKAIDDYNKAVEVFNASDQEDAATEAFEKAKEELEKAEDTYGKQKDAYDKQLDSLKQYEDTMNLLQEKQQELIDQMNDLFDKALELASYKIEIQLDVNDRDLQHLQWLYDNIGESADKVADRIANLNKQAEISVKNIKANADGIRNIFSGLQEAYTDENNEKIIDFSGINLNIDPTDSASLINTVNQVVERMKSVGAEADIQTFLDKITEYEDNLMDEYRNLSDINEQITDNMREAFEEWRDQLEKNLDDNDHMQELLQSYQDIADLLGQEHMGISDEEMQQWRKSMLELQRDAAQVAQANWNYAKDARAKAQKEYEDAIASGNQLAIDQAKAMLEEAEEFEKDAHKEFLERWKETLRMAEEIYQQSLENNEKAYQRALGGGIAPTLDKLQEQLDMQKELDHLHLDDYEKYKKLGDLQANINKQLANNPNVKVQGKLKGLLDDVNEKMAAGAEISEGEATILEKRLQLLQAEDQLMAARNAKSAVRMTRDNEGNFSYTYTADTSKIEEAQQNYADKFYDLLDYERKYSEDTQAAILQSYKEFLDKRNDIINDESLTDSEKKALLDQLERDMKAKVQFYTDEMKMVTDEMGRLKDEDWADMQQTLGRLLAEDDDFETSFEDTTLAKIAPAWNSAAEAMKAFTTAASQLKADDLQAIAEWVNTNEASMQNVGSSTLQFGQELTDVYAKLEEKSNDAKEAAKKMAEETTPKYDQMIAKGKEFSEKYGEYFSNVVTNIDKVVSAIEKLRKSLVGIEEDVDVESIMKDALGETPKSDDTNAEQFDTGGYTGSWGKRGKLAVLHQKELILNEDDTKNMLRAIDILRNIPGLNSNINVNNSIDYSGLAAVGAGDLQQQVHIDASFPNVQSHNEIEVALNNLINSASQYVNRKKS